MTIEVLSLWALVLTFSQVGTLLIIRHLRREHRRAQVRGDLVRWLMDVDGLREEDPDPEALKQSVRRFLAMAQALDDIGQWGV